MDTSFTDIQKEHWSLRHLPPWLKPYGVLARWDRPVGVHLLFIPYLWGLILHAHTLTHPLTTVLYALVGFIGAVLMRGAGCTINDIWDYKLDQQVTRTATRPLASGQLSRFEALLFFIVQCLLALATLFILPNAILYPVFFSLPLIIIYPLMKRLTWWPQVVLGIVFNLPLFVGYTAMRGDFFFYPPSILILYLGLVLWTVGYDTIYAFQDIRDDEAVGVYSSAQRVGHYGKLFTAMIFIFAAMLFLLGLWIHPGIGALSGAIAVLSVLLYTLCFGLLCNIDQPQDCLRFFKLNVPLGYLIVFGTIIDILTQHYF